MPCHFHDAAVRREVPFKNDQPPSRRNRNGQRPDDLLPRRLARLSRFFANRPTRDRELIGMQTVGIQQPLGDQRRAARRIEIGCHEAAPRLEIG